MSRTGIVSPCSRVEGRLEVPGDKSISHRALIVGAMGEGSMTITGLSRSLDVASSLAAVRNLSLSTLESQVRVEDYELSSRRLSSQVMVDSQVIVLWRPP